MPRITEANRRWWTLFGACMGLFLLMLDSTVVTIALPSIQRELGASNADLQWMLNAYLLAVTVLVVTVGRFGDIFGRKRLYLMGLAAFTGGSVLAAVAGDPIVLILARVIQGAGGAALLGLSLAIVSDAFGDDERPRALGIWAGVSALALGLGPLLGGALLTSLSWRWIFWINLPFAVLGFVVTLVATRESRDETSGHRIDIAGLVTFSAGLTAVVLALIEGKGWGWTSATTIGLFAAGVALLVAFWFVEHRVAQPIVDFPLFRNRPYFGANAAAFALVSCYWATMFLQPQYLQNILDHTPLEAGLLILPVTAPMIVISPASGRLIGRFGARNLMTFGMALAVVGVFLQTRITASTGYGLLFVSYLILGIAIGLVYAPMSTAAMTAMPREKAGIAAGVLAMNRILAASLGLALLGALFSHLQVNKLHDELAAQGATLNGADRHDLDGLLAGSDRARAVVQHLPARVHAQVENVAKESFSYALAGAMWVMVALAFVGMVLTWLFVSAARAPPALRPDDLQHHLHHRRFHL
jgi:EmrB/QacA subfamily drug resistance transporter